MRTGTHGFDDKAIQQIREYLHPPEKNISEKPPMENYQKYYENGTGKTVWETRTGECNGAEP